MEKLLFFTNLLNYKMINASNSNECISQYIIIGTIAVGFILAF